MSQLPQYKERLGIQRCRFEAVQSAVFYYRGVWLLSKKKYINYQEKVSGTYILYRNLNTYKYRILINGDFFRI
jgi:hypothetical protein